MSYQAKAPTPRPSKLTFEVTFEGDSQHPLFTASVYDNEQKIARLLAAELGINTTVTAELPF